MPHDRWNPLPRWKPKPQPRRHRKEQWRLTFGANVASCELRDDSDAGDGWQLVIRHDGEVVLRQRYETGTTARYYARKWREDYARSGWTELA